MSAEPISTDAEDRETAPTIPHKEPAGGTGTLEAALEGERNPVKRFLKALGPGLITGASDDDPSGIGTYATAGAALGFATLWTAPLTFPLMAAVQFICAKIGMVSGEGLAGVLRRHYPRWLLFPAGTAATGASPAQLRRCSDGSRRSVPGTRRGCRSPGPGPARERSRSTEFSRHRPGRRRTTR